MKRFFLFLGIMGFFLVDSPPFAYADEDTFEEGKVVNPYDFKSRRRAYYNFTTRKERKDIIPGEGIQVRPRNTRSRWAQRQTIWKKFKEELGAKRGETEAIMKDRFSEYNEGNEEHLEPLRRRQEALQYSTEDSQYRWLNWKIDVRDRQIEIQKGNVPLEGTAKESADEGYESSALKAKNDLQRFWRRDRSGFQRRVNPNRTEGQIDYRKRLYEYQQQGEKKGFSLLEEKK